MFARAGAQNSRVVSAFGPPRRGGERAASLGREWASWIVERHALAEACGGPDRGRQGRSRRHRRDRSGSGGEGPTWLGRRAVVDHTGPLRRIDWKRSAAFSIVVSKGW